MKVQWTCNVGIVGLSWRTIMCIFNQDFCMYALTQVSDFTKFFGSLKLQRHNYNRANYIVGCITDSIHVLDDLDVNSERDFY